MAKDCFDGDDGVNGDIAAGIACLFFYKREGFEGDNEKKNTILLSGFLGFSVLWGLLLDCMGGCSFGFWE